MAAVSSAQATTTTLTPPSSSHGHESWGAGNDHAEDPIYNYKMNGPESSDALQSHEDTFSSGAQMATKRLRSPQNFPADNWEEDSPDGGTLLPAYAPDAQNGRTRSRSPQKRRDDGAPHGSNHENSDQESKWIHRDKLAKIESQELQAAGIFIPRSRAPSKQRSRSTARRGTDASEQGRSRSRKNSATVEQRAMEASVPSWDLRTPEEIAEEEANAYFTSNSLKGSSRIPVAKASPAPISIDYLERGSPAARKHSESPEGDPTPASSRSRSASASLRNLEKSTNGAGPAGSFKRSNTDSSPKKATTSSSRKASGGAKNSAAQARPKTRSGSNGPNRPPTRSAKAPEGDPPWLANSYAPDPRLPPDQQLLPTVARRLQQEQWEREGKHGDVYDKDFRPLNDKALRSPELSKPEAEEEKEQNHLFPDANWPLRPESAQKSPTLRQGSYSTMPKISDKQGTSPMASPRPPQSPLFQPQIEPQSPAAQRVPEEKDEGKQKGGCGCCVVM